MDSSEHPVKICVHKYGRKASNKWSAKLAWRHIRKKHCTVPGKLSVFRFRWLRTLAKTKRKTGSMMLKVPPARLVADHIAVVVSYLAPAQLQNAECSGNVVQLHFFVVLWDVKNGITKLLRQIVMFKKQKCPCHMTFKACILSHAWTLNKITQESPCVIHEFRKLKEKHMKFELLTGRKFKPWKMIPHTTGIFWFSSLQNVKKSTQSICDQWRYLRASVACKYTIT
jgi:hypothetical protein